MQIPMVLMDRRFQFFGLDLVLSLHRAIPALARFWQKSSMGAEYRGFTLLPGSPTHFK